MPASWANALRPTIALLGCGNTPVTWDSSRLVRYSSRVSTLHRNAATCGRTWLAITISSSAALPARSPIPFTVHSTCPVPADLELVLQVDVGGRNEDVDAPARGRPQRLAGEIDVLVGATCQRRQHRAAHLLGDLLDAAVIAGRGRRKARLDHVDVQGIELARHLHLFLGGHGVAGRLLPVAQRGVEDDDVSDHELSLWP